MAAHYHTHIHAEQRRIVQVGAGQGLRRKPCGGRKAGRVVVVNRLRNMNAAQRVAGFLRSTDRAMAAVRFSLHCKRQR